MLYVTKLITFWYLIKVDIDNLQEIVMYYLLFIYGSNVDVVLQM